jgi:hypothetical protein
MLDASAGFAVALELDALAVAGAAFGVAVALVVPVGVSPSGPAHTGGIAMVNAADKTMAILFDLRPKYRGIEFSS